VSAVDEIASDDLYVALATFDGLDTFRDLTLADQQKFVGWIAKARGEAAYWGRIDALVMAMRVAPPRPETDTKLAKVLKAP
jgi:hypothetical protein